MVKLEVAQREDLGRTLTIDAKGNVGLPIIGAVRLEGLTIEEAKATLLRSLQELYPSIQSLSLTLIGEAARRYIFVQGQVARPGKFELEGLLSVWDAIKEAGGTTGSGALESVRLIRAEGDQTTTTIVNVQRALDSGDIKSIPALKPEAFSKVSLTNVSVIPGPTVPAKMTTEPLRSPRPTSLQAFST